MIPQGHQLIGIPTNGHHGQRREYWKVLNLLYYFAHNQSHGPYIEKVEVCLSCFYYPLSYCLFFWYQKSLYFPLPTPRTYSHAPNTENEKTQDLQQCIIAFTPNLIVILLGLDSYQLNRQEISTPPVHHPISNHSKLLELESCSSHRSILQCHWEKI